MRGVTNGIEWIDRHDVIFVGRGHVLLYGIELER